MIGGRKIGFMPAGSYEGLSAGAVCESLKRIGYDAVEWTLHFASPRKHTSAEIKNLVKTTERSGLILSEAVVQQDLVTADGGQWRDAVDFIKQCILVYSDAGIGTINLFTGPVPWSPAPLVVGRDIGEGRAWELLFAAFDELVPEAESAGVNLAVENVWGMLCHDFFTCRYLIDRYCSPRLGVNYDPSHDVLAGHTGIGWIVRQWGAGRIRHVHLKDAAGVGSAGRFLFPLPGEGNVDWADFIGAIDDIGYKGVMSVEFESFHYVSRILGGDWEKAAKLAYDNFTALFGKRGGGSS